MQRRRLALVFAAAASLGSGAGACSGDVARVNACLRYTEAVCEATCEGTLGKDCKSTALDSCADVYEELEYVGDEDNFDAEVDTCTAEVEQYRRAAGTCLYELPPACLVLDTQSES